MPARLDPGSKIGSPVLITRGQQAASITLQDTTVTTYARPSGEVALETVVSDGDLVTVTLSLPDGTQQSIVHTVQGIPADGNQLRAFIRYWVVEEAISPVDNTMAPVTTEGESLPPPDLPGAPPLG